VESDLMKIRPIASGRKGKKDVPEMYKDSKLFSRKHPAQKSVEEVPDSSLENIEPEEEDRPVSPDAKVDKSSEATDILKSFQSRGLNVDPKDPHAKLEQRHFTEYKNTGDQKHYSMSIKHGTMAKYNARKLASGQPKPEKRVAESKELIAASEHMFGKAISEPDTTGKYEGKFKVPLKKMIGMLNQILAAEYAQWMRYYHYALVLRGHYRDALAEEFEGHAEEELKHANVIAMRVIGLGGYPIPRMDDHPAPLKKTEDILKELLFREQRGMELYRQVHAQCGDNEGTRQVLEGNMAIEQEHIDDLWRYLNEPGALHKADMSSGRDTMKPESQKMAEYDHSFARTPEGEGGSPTPDLPDRGKDWHGTVPGVPDEPQGEDEEDEKEMEEAREYFRKPKDFLASKGVAHQQSTDEAIKALSGAARFSPGPFIPPQEKEFMLQQGYTTEEIDAGAQLTPRLRAEFNTHAAQQVSKSLNAFFKGGR
jgi:bacterioferritin